MAKIIKFSMNRYPNVNFDNLFVRIPVSNELRRRYLNELTYNGQPVKSFDEYINNFESLECDFGFLTDLGVKREDVYVEQEIAKSSNETTKKTSVESIPTVDYSNIVTAMSQVENDVTNNTQENNDDNSITSKEELDALADSLNFEDDNTSGNEDQSDKAAENIENGDNANDNIAPVQIEPTANNVPQVETVVPNVVVIKSSNHPHQMLEKRRVVGKENGKPKNYIKNKIFTLSEDGNYLSVKIDGKYEKVSINEIYDKSKNAILSDNRDIKDSFGEPIFVKKNNKFINVGILDENTPRYESKLVLEANNDKINRMSDNAYLKLENGQYVKESKDYLKPISYKYAEGDQNVDAYLVECDDGTTRVVDKSYFSAHGVKEGKRLHLDGSTKTISKIHKLTRTTISNATVIQTSNKLDDKIHDCTVVEKLDITNKTKAQETFVENYKNGDYTLDKIEVVNANGETDLVDIDKNNDRYLWTDEFTTDDTSLDVRPNNVRNKLKYEQVKIAVNKKGEMQLASGGSKYDVGEAIKNDFKTWGSIALHSLALLSPAGIGVILVAPYAVIAAGVGMAAAVPGILIGEPIRGVINRVSNFGKSLSIRMHKSDVLDVQKTDKKNIDNQLNNIYNQTSKALKDLEKNNKLSDEQKAIKRTEILRKLNVESGLIQDRISTLSSAETIGSGFTFSQGKGDISKYNAYQAQRFIDNYNSKLKEKKELQTLINSDKFKSIASKVSKGKRLSKKENKYLDNSTNKFLGSPNYVDPVNVLRKHLGKLKLDLDGMYESYETGNYTCPPDKDYQNKFDNNRTMTAFLEIKIDLDNQHFSANEDDNLAYKSYIKDLEFNPIKNTFRYKSREFSIDKINESNTNPKVFKKLRKRLRLKEVKQLSILSNAITSMSAIIEAKKNNIEDFDINNHLAKTSELELISENTTENSLDIEQVNTNTQEISQAQTEELERQNETSAVVPVENGMYPIAENIDKEISSPITGEYIPPENNNTLPVEQSEKVNNDNDLFVFNYLDENNDEYKYENYESNGYNIDREMMPSRINESESNLLLSNDENNLLEEAQNSRDNSNSDNIYAYVDKQTDETSTSPVDSQDMIKEVIPRDSLENTDNKNLSITAHEKSETISNSSSKETANNTQNNENTRIIGEVFGAKDFTPTGKLSFNRDNVIALINAMQELKKICDDISTDNLNAPITTYEDRAAKLQQFYQENKSLFTRAKKYNKDSTYMDLYEAINTAEANFKTYKDYYGIEQSTTKNYEVNNTPKETDYLFDFDRDIY